MARYRYLVADLMDGTIREEIPFKGVRYGVELNEPGTFTATLALSHPKATRENFEVNRRAIFVEREGNITWGGMLTAFRVEKRRLTVAALGFGHYLNRRRIRVDKVYEQVDQLAIARDLVAYAQSVNGGNIGITLGSETSGVLRDRTYMATDRKQIGEAITQLSEVQGGFDYAFESAWEGTPPTIVRRLTLNYPRRGRTANLVFEYGGNVTDYSYALDGTDQETVVDALGAGDGPAMVIASADDPSLVPVMDGVVTLKDVTEWHTLQHHALTRLMAKRQAREGLTLTVRPTPEAVVGTFIEGDTVRAKVDDGIVQVDKPMRIYAYGVSVSDKTGAESIQLSLLPWETYA